MMLTSIAGLPGVGIALAGTTLVGQSIGAGDAVLPAVLVVVVSWFLFLPLAYTFTFAPGQGWLHFLPQAE